MIGLNDTALAQRCGEIRFTEQPRKGAAWVAAEFGVCHEHASQCRWR
jgi:hypothetical protein